MRAGSVKMSVPCGNAYRPAPCESDTAPTRNSPSETCRFPFSCAVKACDLVFSIGWELMLPTSSKGPPLPPPSKSRPINVCTAEFSASASTPESCAEISSSVAYVTSDAQPTQASNVTSARTMQSETLRKIDVPEATSEGTIVAPNAFPDQHVLRAGLNGACLT